MLIFKKANGQKKKKKHYSLVFEEAVFFQY